MSLLGSIYAALGRSFLIQVFFVENGGDMKKIAVVLIWIIIATVIPSVSVAKSESNLNTPQSMSVHYISGYGHIHVPAEYGPVIKDLYCGMYIVTKYAVLKIYKPPGFSAYVVPVYVTYDREIYLSIGCDGYLEAFNIKTGELENTLNVCGR